MRIDCFRDRLDDRRQRNKVCILLLGSCIAPDESALAMSRSQGVVRRSVHTIGRSRPLDYPRQDRGTIFLRIQELDDGMVLLGQYSVCSNDASDCACCVPADRFIAEKLDETIDVVCGAGIAPHQQSFRNPRPCRYGLAALLRRLTRGGNLCCPEDIELVRKERRQS